jgi:hypothetical protein
MALPAVRQLPRGDEASRPVGAGACVLRCFPADDPRFEADARRILSQCRVTQTSTEVLERVRCRLEALYPDAVVQPRNPLAANGDPDELWYCFRDGGLSPRAARDRIPMRHATNG